MVWQKFTSGIIIAAAVIFIACSGKKEGEHDAHDGQEMTSDHWKEMDDFHMVMAEAFHPYKILLISSQQNRMPRR